MTYLKLINNVLTRLREEKITETQIDRDPYIRSIGAHVNDAKDRVEDAWQWGALRGTDTFPLPSGTGAVYELPSSDDNHYIIKRAFVTQANVETGSADGVFRPLRQITVGGMRHRYLDPLSVTAGQPWEFAVTGKNPSTGNIAITVYPPPEADIPNVPVSLPRWAMVVDRVNHQEALENAADRLLVPSLPVYTLATALASRERGEVGGTPTSELFAIADSHLSDAIAQDSALYANELDWFSTANGWHNTNVRTA